MLISKMFISLLILDIGSLETAGEVICAREFEKTILTLPENPTHYVMSRAWYKDENILVASWHPEKGFFEGPGYEGRLMQVGDGNIQIKNLTRLDIGNYKQFSRLRGVSNTSEASVNLQVIDAPASVCKPLISHEGSKLKAYLPSDDVCATSHLRLEWKDTNKTSTIQNGTTILDLGTDSVEGEYRVCAVGEAAKCFQGNISDLCTNYTAKEELQHGPLLNPAAVVVPVLVTILIIISVLIWKRGPLRKRFCRDTNDKQHTETRQVENGRSMENGHNGTSPSETDSFLELSETTGHNGMSPSKTDPFREIFETTGLQDIKNHLHQLYTTMMNVSLSPVGEQNFVSVSDVYINLDIGPIETTSSKHNLVVKTQNHQFPPIIIFGDSGSGKTTWCKHLIYCWLQHSEMADDEVQNLNLPKLITFKIVLYLSLKSSDQGLSLQELLKQNLFTSQSFEFAMKCIEEQAHPQSILIVIDGLDKIGEDTNLKLVSELLDDKLFSSCTIICTSRPCSKRSILVQSTCLFRLFQVHDLTLEKSRNYVNKVLMKINLGRKKEFKTDNFFIFTNIFNIQCLLKSPYFCLNLLFVWMKQNMDKDNCLLDILLQIINNLLKHAMTDEMCQKQLCKLQQENNYDGDISMDWLNDQPFKNLLIVASRIAYGIFLSEINIAGDESHALETTGCGKDTLKAMCEIGLITESLSAVSNKNLSEQAFTNMLLYDFFVSIAVALKQGPAFDQIVSATNSASKSLIIPMLCEILPTSGNDIFKKIGYKNRSKGKINEDNKKNYSIKFTKEKKTLTDRKLYRLTSVSWLQSLLYTGELDNVKLIFLTNALKFTDSLTILELENHEDNKDLIFWLPFLKTLKKLTLIINNCILMLCHEWNNQTNLNLEETTIRSVVIYKSTLDILANAVKHCKNPKISPKEIRFDMTEILSPGSE